MDMVKKKEYFIVGMQFVLAGLLILAKGWMNSSMEIIYQSYFADVLIPFSFYFLLILASENHSQLKKWWIKALLVFGLCALSETLQYLGIYALARVFDPVDYVMYGLGVLLAAFVDRQVFSRLFKFWN